MSDPKDPKDEAELKSSSTAKLKQQILAELRADGARQLEEMRREIEGWGAELRADMRDRITSLDGSEPGGPARMTEWVRYVVPAELHPDRAGEVCPALVLRDAGEGERTADLIVFAWAHHQEKVTGAPFDEDGAPGSWHRDRAISDRLAEEQQLADDDDDE